MTGQTPLTKTRRLSFTQDEVALGHTRDIYVMRPALFGALVRDFAQQLNDTRGYRAAHLSLMVLNNFLAGRYQPNAVLYSAMKITATNQDALRRGLQPGDYDIIFSRSFDSYTAGRVNGFAADFVNSNFKGYSMAAMKDIITDKNNNDVHMFTSPNYALDLNRNSKKNLLDLSDEDIGAAILYNFQAGLNVKTGFLFDHAYRKHLNNVIFDPEGVFDTELSIRVTDPAVRFSMSGIWSMYFGTKKSSESVNALGRENQLSLYVKRQAEKDKLGL